MAFAAKSATFVGQPLAAGRASASRASAPQAAGPRRSAAVCSMKELRDRIGSVKNTKKITEAMKLVAAAKVRRAQEAVVGARPFSENLVRVLYGVNTRLKAEDVDVPLTAVRPVKKVAIVAIAGDRGLCGGFNNSTSRVQSKAPTKAKRSADQSKAPTLAPKPAGRLSAIRPESSVAAVRRRIRGAARAPSRGGGGARGGLEPMGGGRAPRTGRGRAGRARGRRDKVVAARGRPHGRRGAAGRPSAEGRARGGRGGAGEASGGESSTAQRGDGPRGGAETRLRGMGRPSIAFCLYPG